MRIVSNSGTDRVIDPIRPRLRADPRIDLASRALSLHVFGDLARDSDLPRMAEAAYRRQSEHTALAA